MLWQIIHPISYFTFFFVELVIFFFQFKCKGKLLDVINKGTLSYVVKYAAYFTILGSDFVLNHVLALDYIFTCLSLFMKFSYFN